MYRIKHSVDNSIERYKACLIARGFTQQEGIDYSKTFSPIIKQAIVRLFFSIVVSLNWKIYQLNIHNVFLNGVLTEEVCMKQSLGFVDSTFPSHVCRLHKSLYGLKQASRAWFTHLSDCLLSISFLASKVDTSLFILFDGTNIFYFLVYVNDILLTGSNSVMLHHLIQLLSFKFKLRDLGAIHYFLGIKVQSTDMGLILRQPKYILDILTRAGMTSYNPVDTSVSPSKAIILLDNSFFDPTHFVKSWVLFSVLPSPAQIFVLLLTESVSLCMLLHILIGSPLSVFYATLKVRHLMVSISLEVPHLLYMVLQMQIRLAVLMIASKVVKIVS